MRDEILADYVVMGVFGKHCNKWCLITQQDEPVLLHGKNTVRLHVRRVEFDPHIGLYKLEVGDGSDSQSNVYRRVELKDVVMIKGKLEAVDS